MKVHTDCRLYRGSMPCLPHKLAGACCDSCTHYAPMDSRILIVKLDAMGDVLRTTACLEPLKRQYPRSHVTWITRRASEALLAGNPLVDRILTVESNYLERLLAEDFDLAIGPDTDALAASIMQLASAREKRGFVADRRGGVVPLNAAAEQWWRMGLDDGEKRANRRTYGEWLYAMCELPTPVARPWLRPSAAALDEAGLRLRRQAPEASRWIGFNTGASERWREKRWKVDHYRRLARLLAEASPDAAVVLIGGPGEADLNADLLASHPGMVDGGTTNSIEQFAALVASCDWMLTSDSLGYHVSCAVRTPALCVVGPTAPWELDLYETNQVVHADLDCIACYLQACPRKTTCMDALSADAIWPLVARGDAARSFGPGVIPVSAVPSGAAAGPAVWQTDSGGRA